MTDLFSTITLTETARELITTTVYSRIPAAYFPDLNYSLFYLYALDAGRSVIFD